MKIDVANVSGVHDVYFIFTDGEEERLFNSDYWKFTEAVESKMVCKKKVT